MLAAVVGALASLFESAAAGGTAAAGTLAGTAEGAVATTGAAESMNALIHGASGGMGAAAATPGVMPAAGVMSPSGSVGGALVRGAKIASDPRGAVAGAAESVAKSAISGDTGDTVGKLVGALVGRGSGGGNETPSAAMPQASPVYSESAPKQQFADVSQQVRKVEAPPRYYGGFGAAAPIQQQAQQPEPFNMGQYFAGQLSAFRGK